jgi:hypothetical protein
MGKANAAGAAASVRTSYSNLRLALLVGVCGGVPFGDHGEVILGDVIVSNAVVQYDFGRQYPDKFVRKDTVEVNLGRPDKNIRSLLATFSTDRGLEQLEKRTAGFLKQIQDKDANTKHRGKYNYPGTAKDKLFEPTYRHKHQVPLACVCCNAAADSDPVCELALTHCAPTLAATRVISWQGSGLRGSRRMAMLQHMSPRSMLEWLDQQIRL